MPLSLRRPAHRFFALGAAFLIVFALWTVWVMTGGSDASDRSAAQWAVGHSDAHPGLRRFLTVATHCGGVRANFAIAVCGAGWLMLRRRRRFAQAWIFIAALGGSLVMLAKEAVDRERPPAEWRDTAVHQNNESYPSGHAMGSMVGYGMLGFVLWEGHGARRRRWLATALLAAWVLAIGFSRVYLRAHWASDVAGGYLLGTAYLFFCLAGYHFRRRSGPASVTS